MLAESAQLRKELAEAEKNNDKQKLDEISKRAEQTTMKAININIKMFKNLFILIAIFMLTMWFLQEISPYERDDINLELIKNNPDCMLEPTFADTMNITKEQIDEVYSACYTINQGNKGTWRIALKGDGNTLLADDYMIVENGSKNEVKHDSPRQIQVFQGRENKTYAFGETLKIYAIKNTKYAGTNITATLSMGTSLLWRLPFTIPIINVDNITDINGAFILTLLVIGYSSAIVFWIYKEVTKKMLKKEVIENDKTKEQKQ